MSNIVCSLKGKDLKKHVMNNIIRNYNHWQFLSLSKEEDYDYGSPTSNACLNLPKSVTTRNKRFSVIHNNIDTSDSAYMENLITNNHSPQSNDIHTISSPSNDNIYTSSSPLNDIIHISIHSPQLNDITTNSPQSSDNIHSTNNHNIDITNHSPPSNVIEVFDLTDSPEVASISRLSLNTKNIDRSTIELTSSLEELNLNTSNDNIAICLPCDSTIITNKFNSSSNNNNNGDDDELWDSDYETNKKKKIIKNNKNNFKITKSNSYDDDDDELWDSDYETNKKKIINNKKANPIITKNNSYDDDDELWDSDYDAKNTSVKLNIPDNNDYDEWDEKAVVLTYEPPPRPIIKTKTSSQNNNNKSTISINSSDESADDDDDDFIDNNDSDIDEDYSDGDSVDENTNTNTNITKSNSTSRVIPLAKRKQMSKDMFINFNRVGFDSLLPPDMSVVWSKRLLTTAGITKMKTLNGIRHASIELSIKVVDDETRIRNTLLHEMCHAAAWVVDAEKKPPHGQRFWHWANKCERKIKNANITTCHSYEIFKPFRYECTNTDCKTLYSRHSKNSIDINKHRCGKCRSKLQFLGRFDQNGNTKKERTPSAFSLFVKENYKDVMKSRMSSEGKKAKDIMLVLSKMYKEKTNNNSNDNNNDNIEFL